VVLAIRAIVVDIDGTLTDQNRMILIEGIQALREVQKRGVHVCIASGNVLPVTYGLSLYLGMKGPIIAENGGVVSYREEIFQLNEGLMAEKAYEFLRTKMPVERLFTDNWRRTEVALKRSCDLDKVKNILEGWDVEVEATGFAIHIMDSGHSKMNGVIKAADLLGISIDEFAAFGDSDNDVPMLRGCSVGVAVANASEAAKRAADYIAKEKHAQGVVEGLRYLGIL